MSEFYDLMGNIDQLTDEGLTFEFHPVPARARRMLLIAECIVAGLQAYLHPFEAAAGREGGDVL